MKKLFAIAMSAAMVLSMAAVAFAADPVESKKVVGWSGSWGRVSDNQIVYTGWNGQRELIPYGKTIYFALADQGGNMVDDSDYVKSMSIKASWDMNGSAVSKMEIVKKKDKESGQYYYYLAISTKPSTTTAQTDVSGKVTLKKSGKFGTNGDVEQDVDFALGYVNRKADTSVAITDSEMIWEFDSGEGDEDDEFNFGEWDEAYFTVNTQGQGKIALAADVEYDADIASKYPTANIDFFNGNGASFNKIGELFLPAEANTHIYAINADGTLTSVKATYDEYEEGWKIKTRTLGRYLISDVELKSAAPSVDGSTSAPTVDGVVTPGTPTVPSNPSTGAKA